MHQLYTNKGFMNTAVFNTCGPSLGSALMQMCLPTGVVVKTTAHGRFEITGSEPVRHGLVEYKTSVVRGNQTVSVTNTIPRAINFTIMVSCFLVNRPYCWNCYKACANLLVLKGVCWKFDCTWIEPVHVLS